MKKLLWLALLLALPAGAQTVTPGLTTPQIQTIISGAATGSTVTFAAGTYNLTAGLTLKCGVTYTGPVANPATAILHGAFARESAIIFSLFTGSGYAVPCTTPTAIQYFDFDYAAGIYVQTSFTNLTITHNQFTNTPCCNNQLYDTMVFFDGSSASTNSQQLLGATTVTWNNFGDGVNSCETPTTGAMRLQNGPAGTIDVTGACAGIRENGSVTGPFVIENNTFNHIGEGVPWGCPKFNTSKYACEPSTTGPQTGSGATLHNITVRYNDFNQVHRIPWELQPQQTSGIDFEFNSLHDFYYPFYNTYGLSWACCENGATAPYLVVNNNAIIENTPPPPCTSWVGYGIEAHGTQASYSNNLVEGNWGQGGSCPNAVTGIAWGFGANPRNYANNTITGPYMHPNYIIAECCSYAAPSNLTGNVTGTTSSAITSVAPTISPAAGAQTFPLTVTLTDPGFTSGPQPLGNHSIWYTTDGSSPVPGSGTAQQLPSGGTFVLASAGTVKAVGMWGTGANTPTYPSGYGFVPSGIVSAAYTGSPGGLFISPTGNDANPGTMASPWLTPNHAMTCGQTLTALSGTYSAANFQSGNWGTVTCSAGNNVAWLACQTFDACKITATGSDGMWVSKSYWGIQGWEITTNTTATGACFHAGATSGVIHHIIFANNVANGCMGGGFNSYAGSATASADYIVYVGNVAYNAAQGTGACYSGFNVYKPIASDTVAGTHIYVAGNFSYGNVDGSPCNSGLTTDGEGINLDTFDWSQSPTGPAYVQQAVVQNNISVANGSSGILQENNKAGSSAAPTYFKQNTTYGNLTASNRSFCTGLGELYFEAAFSGTATGNLAMTNAATGCMSDPIYAFSVANANSTVSVAGNWLYSAAGNTTFISSSPGFSYGANTTTTNPVFASTTVPGAPSCGSSANVPACMSTLVSNFTPTASGSSSYGYQIPSSISVTDALYPAWLCSVTLPSGLVTPGCGGTTATLTGGFQGNSGSVNTLAVGAPAVQQTAIGTYSDGINRTLPDAFGNTAIWSSSNTGVLNVTSSGMVSCVGTGTANSNIISSPGGIHFSPWGWTCTAAVPAASTGLQVIVISENRKP